MAFFRDDTDYTHRQTGFARYKQLMTFYAFHWLRINMLATVGALPLAAGILFAILTSSLVVLLPLSFLGGMIFGPFLAGLVDAIMRGLRDAPNNWWKNYKKSWRQNWRSSLVPGGVLGAFVGLFAFIVYIMSVAQVAPSLGTIIMMLVSASVVIWLNTLYWPQLVLFQQSAVNRMRNAILFTIKHSVRVLVAVVIQVVWIALIILFAPWTLIVIPFLGFWFPIFLAQYRIYADLNNDLRIEEQFIPVEGDPWAKDAFEETGEEPEEPLPPDDGIRRWEALVKSVEQNKEAKK
ncbi:MAG: hypothetical protein IJJ23_00840 [Clostridia bacterium]|nr:hypothetical protein [Clostridia bacterium]